jgi:hypothetical protein
MIENKINEIYQQLKQELKQAASGVPTGNISVLHNLALAKCNKAKTDITTEYTKILRGGKSISTEFGMSDELTEAMKSLAELRRLKNEEAIKEQKMQESWCKLVIYDPDVRLDPHLPNPYNRREGGSDYES